MKLVTGTVMLAVAVLVCARPSSAQVREADVTGGRVAGAETHGIVSFKGIPFAAPPVGALRWKAPQRVQPWSGVKQADSFGPGCVQAASPYTQVPSMSEDCLSLNVWTPAKAANDRLPVLVWIYGGAFTGGGGRGAPALPPPLRPTTLL
jgi:para-nitrobenzyl esterase